MVGRCLRARLGKLSDLGLVAILFVMAIEAEPCVEWTIAGATVECSAIDFVDVDVGVLMTVEIPQASERLVAGAAVEPLRGDVVCSPVFIVRIFENLLHAVQLVFVRFSGLMFVESSDGLEVVATGIACVLSSGLCLRLRLQE